jgi:hypothetical protein
MAKEKKKEQGHGIDSCCSGMRSVSTVSGTLGGFRLSEYGAIVLFWLEDPSEMYNNKAVIHGQTQKS